jgi:hypothetical protein
MALIRKAGALPWRFRQAIRWGLDNRSLSANWKRRGEWIKDASRASLFIQAAKIRKIA